MGARGWWGDGGKVVEPWWICRGLFRLCPGIKGRSNESCVTMADFSLSSKHLPCCLCPQDVAPGGWAEGGGWGGRLGEGWGKLGGGGGGACGPMLDW